MQFDFEVFLVLASFITGLIVLLDKTILAKRRAGDTLIMPRIIESAHSFFPVLLIVLLLRSFLVEPFRIPTGSLEPSLLPGDFVAVNKFTYGIRLPAVHTKIFDIHTPKKGDIVVFRWPVDPSMDFIKRVIGVPGDTVSYIDKKLYINHIIQPQKDLGLVKDKDKNKDENETTIEQYEEILNGVKHDIYIHPDQPAQDFTVTVPPGQYFMMGDNRDNSEDSRYWGFVPEANLLGKAFLVWLSWHKQGVSFYDKIRWDRIGKIIND